MFLWFGIYYSTARGFCKKHPLSPAKREKSLKKTSLFPFTRQKLPGDALSVTAAASGDAAQWAAPITDRRGSGDQALNGAHWAPAPPKGGAKSRLPLWGRCHAKGMTERAFPAAPAAHVRYPLDEHERSELPWARIVPRGHAPRIVPCGHAPPKALLQSIEISAILEVHGIPCGSLPRNGTSRLLARPTGRTACKLFSGGWPSIGGPEPSVYIAPHGWETV